MKKIKNGNNKRKEKNGSIKSIREKKIQTKRRKKRMKKNMCCGSFSFL